MDFNERSDLRTFITLLSSCRILSGRRPVASVVGECPAAVGATTPEVPVRNGWAADVIPMPVTGQVLPSSHSIDLAGSAAERVKKATSTPLSRMTTRRDAGRNTRLHVLSFAMTVRLIAKCPGQRSSRNGTSSPATGPYLRRTSWTRSFCRFLHVTQATPVPKDDLSVTTGRTPLRAMKSSSQQHSGIDPRMPAS